VTAEAKQPQCSGSSCGNTGWAYLVIFKGGGDGNRSRIEKECAEQGKCVGYATAHQEESKDLGPRAAEPRAPRRARAADRGKAVAWKAAVNLIGSWGFLSEGLLADCAGSMSHPRLAAMM
jgi:hypothetical protein